MPRRISLRTICKLGTLAHNRAFSRLDFVEYTNEPRTTLDVLKKRGVVKPLAPNKFYPTGQGWKLIERACRLAK